MLSVKADPVKSLYLQTTDNSPLPSFLTLSVLKCIAAFLAVQRKETEVSVHLLGLSHNFNLL